LVIGVYGRSSSRYSSRGGLGSLIGLDRRSVLRGVCGLIPRVPIDFDYASGFDLVDGGKFRSDFDYTTGFDLPDDGGIDIRTCSYWFENEGDMTPNTRIANDVVGGFLEAEPTVGRHFVTEDLRVSEADLAPRANLNLIALDPYATDTLIPFFRNNLKQ